MAEGETGADVNARAGNTLDLRAESEESFLQVDPVKDVPLYSDRWATVVRPFTFFIFALLALVVLLPFGLVIWLSGDQLTTAFDWAKTILAPIVGFASAAVGYYYGTRQSLAAGGDGPRSESGED